MVIILVQLTKIVVLSQRQWGRQVGVVKATEAVVRTSTSASV